MKNTSKKYRQRRKNLLSRSSARQIESLETRIALTGSPISIDLNATGASNPSDFVQVGSQTYFVAQDDTNGRELWQTDGTIAGTSLVADILSGPGSSSPQELFEFNGSILFVANDGTNGEELWISDGTQAGTNLVLDIFPGQDANSDPLDSQPREFVEANGNVFFRAQDADGAELWVTDGTAAGTAQVVDIATGTFTDANGTFPLSSNPTEFVEANNSIFFSADDGNNGRELWTSDGTAAGTFLLKDIATGTFLDSNNDPQPNSSAPIELTELNGNVFFAAASTENGAELWRTDGTEAGTVLVTDINPGTADALNANDTFAVANGTIFFSADDGTNGAELWSSDGTAAGTQLVRDIRPGSIGSLSQIEFATIGNTVYFTADNGLDGAELWKTDGSEAGTVLVADINDSSSGTGSNPGWLTPVAGSLFFAADDGIFGREIWETDGTAAGTVLVADIASGTDSSEPVELFNFNGTVLFGANDGPGFDLWSVDSAADPVAAPTGIDLLAVADTGDLDDDNLTSFNNSANETALLFEVTGLIAGADVQLFSNDVLIGTATAVGTSATFTSNGTVTLAEGLQTLRATQTVNGSESAPSPELQITIDSTAPSAVASSAPATAQVAQTYSFDADSPDEGNAGIAYSLVSEPSGMTIDSQTGVISWTPTETQLDPQMFQIVVTDAAGNTTTSDVDITVLGVIPAQPDNYNVEEDDTLTVSVVNGVLANDGDTSLTVTVVAPVAEGTLTLAADGSFTYVPNANFNGTDVFSYRASDGTDESNVALVTINVAAVNDAPSTTEDTYLATEDVALTVDVALGVLANDSDVDGDTLTASIATQATNGTVALNADGSFVYTPDADFSGDDSFEYTVSDGTITSDPIEVGVRVAAADDVPTAAADSYSLDEDTPLTIDAVAGVLANDIDPDAGTLTATVVNIPDNGTLVLNDDGSFTYTPDPDFNGSDTFTYTASNGTNTSAEATVSLTVNSIADAPVAANDTFTAANNGTSRTLDVLANDDDADGTTTLTITDVTAGSNGGTIEIDGGQLTYTAMSGFVGAETFDYTVEDSDGQTATATVTVNVGDASVGNMVSGLVYVDHDGDGTKSVSESGVPGSQIILSGEDTAGVSIDMTTITLNDGSFQFDDVPSGTYTLTQTQPQALVDGSSSTNDSGATADGNVISNLSVTSGQDTTGNNFSETGLLARYHSIVWFFAKQRNPQSSGDVFREVVAIGEEDAGNQDLANAIRNGGGGDDGGTDPGDGTTPVAVADSYSTTLDQTLTVAVGEGVLANDTDPNGDTLTATVATTTGNGTLTLSDDGSFTYVPNSGFSGTDTFTYTASDGTNTSEVTSVTISVQDDSTNAAPVAVAETYSVDEDQTLTIDAATGLLNNDTDADSDSLTAAVRTTTANGTLTLADDGSFTYQPNTDFEGDDTFTYVANDGTTDSNEVTVTITVNPINDGPTGVDDTFTMNEDGTLSRTAPSGVLANDTDVDDTDLTVTLLSGPSSGTLTLNADGSFSYTAAPDFNGEATFTYEVADPAGETSQATVSIAIAAVNDRPEAANDTFTIDEDTTLAIDAVMSLLNNDTDVDNDTLTAELVANPTNGTVTLNSDGTFTYVPNANFAGADVFTYAANDGTLSSNTAAVTINVTEIDDQGSIILPAEFADPNQIPSRTVGQPITIDVDVDDVDDDDYGYMLDLEASGIPSDAAMPVIDPGTGEITWTPTATGRFAIRVIVVNGDREADQETFLVDILASDVDNGT